MFNWLKRRLIGRERKLNPNSNGMGAVDDASHFSNSFHWTLPSAPDADSNSGWSSGPDDGSGAGWLDGSACDADGSGGDGGGGGSD